MNRDKSIFVLGGAGYIGSHVAKELYLSGYLPVVIDNLCQGYRENVLWGPLHILDIADTSAMIHLLNEYKPLAIIHLAAYLAVGESVKNPHKYYKNNVLGTISLLSAIEKTGPVPLVFSSTAAVYGAAPDHPIQENYPLNPLNPYGQSKRMVEQILADFSKAYQWPSISLRYFNAAGADLGLQVGSRQIHPSNLIPLILKSIKEKASVLEIYGNDYPTEDGTCVRDYIHVTDLAKAHVKAVQKLLSGDFLPPALNLGTGKGHSVSEVLTCMEQVSNKKIPVKIASRREGDGAILIADSSLAHKTLSWQPVYSDLKTICESAWLWHCQLNS
jgi:UDP-arabinose 4-epimerase